MIYDQELDRYFFSEKHRQSDIRALQELERFKERVAKDPEYAAAAMARWEAYEREHPYDDTSEKCSKHRGIKMSDEEIEQLVAEIKTRFSIK